MVADSTTKQKNWNRLAGSEGATFFLSSVGAARTFFLDAFRRFITIYLPMLRLFARLRYTLHASLMKQETQKDNYIITCTSNL